MMGEGGDEAIAPSGDISLLQSPGKSCDPDSASIVLPEDSCVPYEPYEHRNVTHPLTYWDALSHMIKGALGTGILTMPHAFKDSGYLLGFLGTVAIGAFTTSCIQILVRAQYELCRRKRIPSLTYPEILGAALSEGPARFRWLAPYGRGLSFTAMIVDEIGALCVYLLFIASNLSQVCVRFWGVTDLRLYMLVLFPPLLLISWVPNLKYIVPFSSSATGVMFVSLAITMYYILGDFPSFSDRTPVGHLSDLPLFVGVTLFSLSSIGVTMPLENEMQHPRQFTARLGVLNVSSAINTTIFAAFGLLAYLKYGDEVQGSITLNLPQEDTLAVSVKLLLSVSILFTFALPHFIVYDIVWNRYLKLRMNKSPSHTALEYGFRTLIVVITLAFSILIPNLELFVSLIGALCMGLMSLGIPAIVDLLTFWHVHTGAFRVWFIFRNVVIILVGCFGTATGVYFSIKKIAQVVFHMDNR
ncbi:hypothetical protein M8J77_024532 [Diaphorina citri]|nr:hypothetical protein M8J77_024532 [Diaphorina citri]